MPLQDAPQVGDDAGIRNLLRRITDLEAQLRMVAAASAGQSGQVDFLLGQTSIDESSPAAFATVTTNPASNTGWFYQPFDADRDVSRLVTTSSTGRLAIQLGCYLYLRAVDGATALGSVGLEVMSGDGSTQLRIPGIGDGNLTHLKAPTSGALEMQIATNGHGHILQLDPDTTYLLRTRRMWAAAAGTGAAPVATTGWQGTSLQVTKLGM